MSPDEMAQRRVACSNNKTPTLEWSVAEFTACLAELRRAVPHQPVPAWVVHEDRDVREALVEWRLAMHRAFGAPGDYGYGYADGEALAWLYAIPLPPRVQTGVQS